MLKWIGLVGVGAVVAVAGLTLSRGGAAGAEAAVVTVYRSPSCGCCHNWVEHLEAAGFEVKVIDADDLQEVKALNGVTSNLASCHTALVEGYVVEGHVPAADVKRLLAERPAIAGLAVPGMPIGSPGMEGPNPQRYDVVAFDRAGRISVWARH